DRPIPLRHCAEQSWYTARLHDTHHRLRRLPSACNYQFWDQSEFQDLPAEPGVILHFAGIVPHRPNEERLAIMREFVAGLPAAQAARDCAFDLVIVDGNHAEDVVAEETRLLLAAGVKAVFAHDTSPAAITKHKVPLGPSRLTAAFRGDPRYRFCEDSAYRTG